MENICELQNICDMNKNIVLDVRSEEEYNQGHIPKSTNVPHDQIDLHTDKLKVYEMIYIYCRSGRRAKIVESTLKKMNFDNIVVFNKSGIEDWIKKGLRIEK